jgi:hypothetical protein
MPAGPRGSQGVPIFASDVSQVQDVAAADQTQIVNVDGKRGLLQFVAWLRDVNTL